MKVASLVVLGFFLALAVLLFVGGIVSAAREIRAERAAGVPVLRPGWNRADRLAVYGPPKTRYALPRGTGFIVWPLVAFGRADIAERYLLARGGSVEPR